MTAAAGNNEIPSCAIRVIEHRGRENNEVTVASSIVAELDGLDGDFYGTLVHAVRFCST